MRLLRNHHSARYCDVDLTINDCLFDVTERTTLHRKQKSIVFFSLLHSKVVVCCAVITPSSRSVKLEVGLSENLNVYSSFEFPIQVNIRLGNGGKLLERGKCYGA